MALIAIQHPDIEPGPRGPAKVSERAFELVWQHKGWQKIEGSEQEAPERVLPAGSLDQQIARAQKALEQGKLAGAHGGDPEAPATGGEPKTPALTKATGTRKGTGDGQKED